MSWYGKEEKSSSTDGYLPFGNVEMLENVLNSGFIEVLRRLGNDICEKLNNETVVVMKLITNSARASM